MNFKNLGLESEAAQKLQEFTVVAAAEWRAEMIVLVGSYASGRYVRGVSDIDILIVTDKLAPGYFAKLILPLSTLSSLVRSWSVARNSRDTVPNLKECIDAV